MNFCAVPRSFTLSALAKYFHGILTEILNISWGTGPYESKYTSCFMPVDGARVRLTARNLVSGGSMPLKVQHERQTAGSLSPHHDLVIRQEQVVSLISSGHTSLHPFILKKDSEDDFPWKHFATC